MSASALSPGRGKSKLCGCRRSSGRYELGCCDDQIPFIRVRDIYRARLSGVLMAFMILSAFFFIYPHPNTPLSIYSASLLKKLFSFTSDTLVLKWLSIYLFMI